MVWLADQRQPVDEQRERERQRQLSKDSDVRQDRLLEAVADRCAPDEAERPHRLLGQGEHHVRGYVHVEEHPVAHRLLHLHLRGNGVRLLERQAERWQREAACEAGTRRCDLQQREHLEHHGRLRDEEVQPRAGVELRRLEQLRQGELRRRTRTSTVSREAYRRSRWRTAR